MLRLSGGWILAALLTVVPCVAAPAGRASTTDEKARQADALHQHALARLAERTIDQRRLAIAELERASLLDPARPQIWLDLGRLFLEAGQRARGRSCYERATRLAPTDASAHLTLGSAWKWEWLSSFDDSALVRAQRNFARATTVAPERADAWSALSALELARGHVRLACLAALQGHAADSSAWEPLVALACAWYRGGALGWADSTFRVALERLPSELRLRFEDLEWITEDPDSAPGRSNTGAGDPQGATWPGSDPDLTTPENEAELDCMTRLGLALLLFRDEQGLRWDKRAELFVRYGPPTSVEVNPLSSPLGYRYDRHMSEMSKHFLDYAPDPLGYPFNVQAWSYPELGMRVELWDRSLRQSFEFPVAVDRDPDPRANPALMASRPDLTVLAGGRGVFRAMPPGVRPMAAGGQLSRFPSDRGAILVAHVVAAGEPADALQGSWAVVAADGSVVTRGSRMLSASACDPTGLRVADFTADVPPGAYRVDLAVSDPRGRRGIVRLAANVTPAPAALALSDLVLLCGMEATVVGADAVRFEPNLEGRVSGSRPISVYFEIDHLTPGNDGRARFAYTYVVRPVRHDDPRGRKAAPAFEASREETHDGTRRRQFVTVPLRSLKRGTYDLEIEVRDLLAGTVAGRAVRFDKE